MQGPVVQNTIKLIPGYSKLYKHFQKIFTLKFWLEFNFT